MPQNPPSAHRTLPVIGITIGDPAGIGPEVTLRALHSIDADFTFEPFVVGDLRLLRQVAADLEIEVKFCNKADAEYRSGQIKVVDLQNVPAELVCGREGAEGGRASAEYIECAVGLWRNGEIDAVVTAPINKQSLKLAGYPYPGHTEFLAELAGTSEVAMSFFAGDLRVVLLTTHLPLAEAIQRVRKEALADLIRFADVSLARLLGRQVKIAVAGLNPHASDNGLFGDEESTEIEPAIALCRDDGIEVSGPYSPDTIFLRGHRGEFDAVIACYHDQATIAVKCLSFGSAVNVTLGLPFVRTSVDHGTAFDIAGKGIADASSMQAAITLAARLALQKNLHSHNQL